MRMQMQLRRLDLWSLIAKSIPRPLITPIEDYEQPDADEVAAAQAWDRKDLAAQSEIFLALGDRQLQLVRT